MILQTERSQFIIITNLIVTLNWMLHTNLIYSSFFCGQKFAVFCIICGQAIQ